MATGSGHTAWCGRGHLCGLGEHRAEPITLTVPAVGRGVLTRVAGSNGRGYAEIRLVVALPDDERQARGRLCRLLARLPGIIGR